VEGFEWKTPIGCQRKKPKASRGGKKQEAGSSLGKMVGVKLAGQTQRRKTTRPTWEATMRHLVVKLEKRNSNQKNPSGMEARGGETLNRTARRREGRCEV